MVGEIRVILDTNFLMIPGQFIVDIFEELDRLITDKYEPVTFSTVIGELENLAEGVGEKAGSASLALDLINMHVVKILPGKGNVDKQIIQDAKPGDVVCTNDAALKKAVLEKGARVVSLRDKSHLDFVQ